MCDLCQYAAGVVCLAVSEVAYGAWMVASLMAWWRSAPQAELARRGMDLLHDLKPALLAVDRYRDVARPLYDMIEVCTAVCRRILSNTSLFNFTFPESSKPYCIVSGAGNVK